MPKSSPITSKELLFELNKECAPSLSSGLTPKLDFRKMLAVPGMRS